jgi:hypothetical protein
MRIQPPGTEKLHIEQVNLANALQSLLQEMKAPCDIDNFPCGRVLRMCVEIIEHLEPPFRAPVCLLVFVIQGTLKVSTCRDKQVGLQLHADERIH